MMFDIDSTSDLLSFSSNNIETSVHVKLDILRSVLALHSD